MKIQILYNSGNFLATAQEGLLLLDLYEYLVDLLGINISKKNGM
jgi:hypothetical protein